MPKWTVIDGILHQVFCGCDEEWELLGDGWQQVTGKVLYCRKCGFAMWRHDDSYLKGL